MSCSENNVSVYAVFPSKIVGGGGVCETAVGVEF